MIDNVVTEGERLCNFINHRLLASAPWDNLAEALQPTGRQSALVDFYRQITAVGLTGRLVAAGKSLQKILPLYEPTFKREFLILLRDYVGIPARLQDEAYRFAFRAVEASLENVKESTLKQIRTFAMRTHPNCYMCGVALDFDDQNNHAYYTCEHIWPQAYGGNGITENLLPACYSCNNLKKQHFATWVMPAVQSLVLGLSPAESRLQEIDGSFKFALHYRAAQKLATKHRITLKNAFLRLGPWQDVRIRDENDIVDVFNLENYAPDQVIT